MYTLTIDDLPRYPARFFYLAKVLQSFKDEVNALIDSIKIAANLSAYRWSAQEVENMRYLASASDYTDFECRMKTLKYLGKM